MSLPSSGDLQKRQTELAARIERLKRAHDYFLSEWSDIHAGEKEIIDGISSFVDKGKMIKILAHISSLPNT